MTTTILPMTDEHLEAAAALLAARHRCDRQGLSELSPVYDDPGVTRPILQSRMAQDDARGVVAMRESRLVGYCCGAPDLLSPTRTFAGFMLPRSAAIPYAGYALAADEDISLLSHLYAALAREWVAQGLIGHYITIPARPDMGESWANLGFGRFLALGVRPTEPASMPPSLHPALDVRRATRDDEERLQEAMSAFFRSFADPPIFVPFLPETAADRRRFVVEHLADPACPVWLACTRDRQIIGFQLFVEPTSPQWDQSALETPPRALYLHIAYTETSARSTGVGAALLAQTMAWAHEAGYETCLAHWVTASRAAAFWRRQDFRPISYWLCRTVDARATWATGRC